MNLRWLWGMLLVLAGGAALGEDLEFCAREDLAQLEEHEIAPRVAGLRLFFQPPGPAEEEVKLARLWAAQLGSEKFEVREAASAKLLAMGLDALEVVEQAARGDDAEVRARAGGLLLRLNKLKERRDAALPAVLRTIVREEFKGLAPHLLKVAPHVSGHTLEENLRRALWATVTPADAAALRAAIGSGAPFVRRAAVLALPAAVGEAARDELASLLTHDDPHTRLAAAQALAPLDRPAAWAALLDGLEADDLAVRMHAAESLAGLTGERLGYAPYAPPEQRGPAVQRWKEWQARNPEAPLRQPLEARPLPMGRLILCYQEPFGAAELDEAGRVRLGLAERIEAPSGCAITPEGWRVLGDWGSQALLALDGQGEEAWRVVFPGLPNSLERLPDGSFLTSLFDEREILRVRPDGATVWKTTVAGKPSDTRGLPNGNVLACLYTARQVVELDQEGKVVWRIENLPPPESARRLENGNTLVASSLSKVLEYAPDGTVVWSYTKDVPLAFDALELPNGNVLIGYRRGLREVDRAGDVVREIPLSTVRRICAY